MKKIINLLLISFIAAGLTACWSEDIPEAGAARHQVTDLTATPGDEEVLLSWSLPEGWNPTDFIVYYTDADSETVTLRTGGEMNCTVGGLVNDTQYTFYVQAVYGKLVSNYVAAVGRPATTRFPVTDLTVDAGDSFVSLAWTKPATTVLSYTLSYYNEDTPDNVEQQTLDKDATSVTLDKLINDKNYYFSLTANYEKGASEPATPVQVLGLTSVPTAGDLFLVASDDRTARQIAEKRQATERAAQLAKRRKVVSLESLKEQFAKSEVDMLNIVIKGDSSGSVEALEDSLMKIEVSDEVGIQVIHRGVGAITQNDVNLATVDKAVIIGFNVRPNRQVADLAEREGVEIKYYSIIYKAIEDIEASLKGMLKPEYEEVVTSHSEIREIFRSSKFGNIAGVMVQDGEVKRGTKCRILRNGIATVNDLEISSLRRFKDDVNSVKEGYEAGINLGTFNDIEIGDIIETFEMQEIERK